MAINANDLRSTNDNSKEWRDKRLQLTENLLRSALKYIHTSDKDFSQKNVSKVMKLLANDEQKKYKAPISPSAISKSPYWKNIIQSYVLQNELIKEKKSQKYSQGDLALEIHKCKTLLSIAKNENKIFRSQLEKLGTSTDTINMSTVNITQSSNFDYHFLLKEAYKQMIKDGIMFINSEGNMVLEEDIKRIFATKDLLQDLGI
jgi:hypothetical protein